MVGHITKKMFSNENMIVFLIDSVSFLLANPDRDGSTADAKAIEGENEAQAVIAASRAELAVREAKAYQRGETSKRESEAAVLEAQNLAMAKAATAEAKRIEAERRAQVEAPAKAQKAKTIVEAEALAEKRRIEAEGEAKAYAIPVLDRHELVNDRFGDKPIAVGW